MFIDLHLSTVDTDLVASYQQIKHARLRLLGKWRFALLRAYAKRRDRYYRELTGQRARQARLKRFQWPVWLGLPVLCVAGYVLAFTVDLCSGTLVMFAAGIGILVAWAIWRSGSRTLLPPGHPLAQRGKDEYISPLKKTLFPPTLLTRWRRELSDPIPSEAIVKHMTETAGQYGLIGEYNLVRALVGVVSPETVILHSVMPKARDDLDVVVIGPKGIWYFEVKYLNAHIEWQEGQWTIGKLDHRTGEIKFENMSEYPDHQWYRMRGLILRNLQANEHRILSAYPEIGKIRGGVVFAHPDATFNIHKPPSFSWGRTQAWVNAYEQAPRIPGMSPPVILRLSEVFLEKHREVNPSQQVFSMNAAVDQILQAVEGEIEEWIKAS